MRLGQPLADALRNTLCVIIPLCLFFVLGHPEAAVGIATGSLLICVADLPGNRSDKGLTAWSSLLVFSLVSLSVAYSLSNSFLLAGLMGVLTIALTLLGALSFRLSIVGLMGVILATFTIGFKPTNPLMYTGFILLGGLWYHMVSLLQVWLFPYHPLRRAMEKARMQTAQLLRLRADGYDPSISLSGFNGRNISLLLKLSASHELIRRLLLGDKVAARRSDPRVQRLLREGIVLIDLYEKVAAVHYDYGFFRNSFGPNGTSGKIAELIRTLADLLEGEEHYQPAINNKLVELQEMQIGANNGLLLRVNANLKETLALIESLLAGGSEVQEIDMKGFGGLLSEGKPKFSMVIGHLIYSSPLMRFALRLAVLMVASVLVIGLLPMSSYGQWLPLTMLVVSRPSFALTRKRVYERITGTALGLILGWVILALPIPIWLQLVVAALSLLLFFIFMLSRYWLAALGVTLAVVLCMSIYRGHAEQVFIERLAFTLLGTGIGLVATFLFPIWASGRVNGLLLEVLKSNRTYLNSVMAGEDGLQLRISRKASYVSLSALSEALTLATGEGKNRIDRNSLRQLELLSFQLNALIASYAIQKEHGFHEEAKALIAIDYLNEAISSLETGVLSTDSLLKKIEETTAGVLDLETVSMKIGLAMERFLILV